MKKAYFFRHVIWVLMAVSYFAFANSAEKPLNKKSVNSSSKIRKIDGWNIKVGSKELDLGTVFAGKTMLVLHGPLLKKALFVSVECDPFDVATAHKKVKEWGGKPKSLKIQKFKKGSIVSFVDTKLSGMYWLATDGACLIANVDRLNKKIYRSLRAKVSRSFK